MNRKFLFRFIVITLLLLWGCNCHKSPTEPTPKEQRNYIRGKVILENQTNHGSCFVWVDSLWIGTVTDSNGFFEILIPDSLDSTNGIFEMYYYILGFKWAKATIELTNGQLVPGKHDVEDSGFIKSIILAELASISLTTDKSIYSASEDTIRYTIQVQNLSNEEIIYIKDGLVFYNIPADSVTVYKPFDYPSGPPGEFIAANETFTEDGILFLPIDQSYPYPSYYRLPEGIIPCGDYFFILSSRIQHEPYFDINFKKNNFFTWTSFQYPIGFVDIFGWSPRFNIYDPKNIGYKKLTIIP